MFNPSANWMQCPQSGEPVPQSLSFVLVHVVFSTRNRIPCLDEQIRQRLYAYLATIVRSTGCECYGIGGTEDHVHIAIRLARTISIADVIRQTKAGSSHWVRSLPGDWAEFAWQAGYGAFSVEPNDKDGLCDYIESQPEHHRDQSFKQEYQKLIESHRITFDPNHLWD